MAVSLSPIGGSGAQFFDNNGVPLTGGKLYSYEAGTTTPKTTYTSFAGATANTNPIVLDAAGRPPAEIWLTSGDAYKFVLTTSTGTQIGTWDNIYGYSSGSADATTEVQTATAGQTLFVLSTMAYNPGANTLGVYIDGVNQVVGNAYVETSATSVTFVSGLHEGAVVKFINMNVTSADASTTTYEPGPVGSVATTVQAKLRETVSVKDFGAVGDGVTDDTAAIQAALDVGSGRTVYFPEGQYIVSSSLSVKARTYIVGEQRGQLSGITTGRQNYFGDYLNGTLIKYTGEWACFELIGDGTADGAVDFCKFENLALWGAPLTVTTVFADYKPKHFNSRGWSCHYGGGHQWVNCWFTSFGYAGIEIGIQGTYNGVTYEAHKSGTGRPTNCKVENCYSSNVFGYGLIAYTEQFQVEGWESDSFTINSSAYSGFQNPINSNYETGAVFLANSINCRFQSCHFEGHSGRSSGVNVVRYQVDGASSYPLQNRFVNCNFYGNIYSLQIGREGTGTPFETQVVGCAFNAADNSGGSTPPIASIYDAALQTVIDACSFTGGTETQSVYTSGTSGVLSNSVFKSCNLPITAVYTTLIEGNTTTSTVGTYAVVVTGSTPPRLVRNAFDKPVDLGSAAFAASSNVDDYRLGVQSSSGASAGGTFSISHVGAVTATPTGTLVGTVNMPTAAQYKPVTMRIRCMLDHSSQRMGEAVVTFVSILSGSPNNTLSQFICGVNYSAVSDFLDFTTSTGTIEILVKSSAGVSATSYFQIELLGSLGVSYVPEV